MPKCKRFKSVERNIHKFENWNRRGLFTLSGGKTYTMVRGHRGALRRRRILPTCAACGSEAGLLLVTLPTNNWQRPRTKQEAVAVATLTKIGLLTPGYLLAERRRRRVRVCQVCVKPLAVANDHRPVGEWDKTK